MESIESKVAQKVKFKRKESGLTQIELARAAGVSRRSLISIEKGGHVKLSTVNKVLAVFGLSATYDVTFHAS